MDSKKIMDNKRRQLPPPRIFTTKMAPLLTDVKDVAPPPKPRPLTWNVGECPVPNRVSLSSLPVSKTRQQFQGYNWSLHIGSKVCIGGAKTGRLLFFGETKFAPGLWCGVELTEPVGKNDGTVCGIRYFTCEPKHGIFAPPHKVDLLKEDWQTFVAASQCSDNSQSNLNIVTPHHLGITTTAHGTATFCPELPDTKPNVNILDPNCTFNVQQEENYSDSVTRRETDDNKEILGNTYHLELSSKVPHSAGAVDGDRKLSAGATFEISNSASVLECALNRHGQITKDSFSLYSDKERTFTIDHYSYMQSTPICNAKNCGPCEATGGGSLPWLNTNDSYVIHSQHDDDGSYLEDGGIVDSSSYHYCVMVGGARQCSVELDESLGILTPDQMKDFTIAAETGPAQTPSDEGIQEIVEEEVVDYIPEGGGASEMQESVPKFHTLNEVDEAICKGGHGEPDVTNTFNRFWSQHYNLLFEKGVEEQSIPGECLNEDLGLTNLFSTSSNTSWATCKNESKTPEDRAAADVITDPSLLNLKSIESSAAHSVIIDQTCQISQKLSETTKNDNNQTSSPFSPLALKQGSAVVRVANMLRDLDVTLKKTDIVAPDDENGGNVSASNTVEYLVQELNNGIVQQTEGEKQEQVTSGMAVSITSIDTGYQGDAECELQSEMDTNAANTPVEELHKEFQPIVMGEFSRHPKGDAGSDSDFCSDMAASWTESDLELDDRARGRGARIIDGRLYLSNACISKDTEGTESTESLIEDVDSAKTSESVEKEPAAHEDDPNATVIVLPAVENNSTSDNRLSASSLDSTAASQVTVSQASIHEEVRDNAEEVLDQTLMYEAVEEVANVECCQTSEEPNLAEEELETTPSPPPPPQQQPQPQPPKVQTEESHKNEIGQTTPKSSKWLVKMKTPTSSKKTSSKLRPGNSHGNSPQDKDSPTATSKKLKMPKKNVMSKIKAMIGATSNKLTNKDPTSPHNISANEDDVKKVGRTPKKNRWDTVMSKIQAGQVEEKAKGKKEIVSKVNTNRVPSKGMDSVNGVSRKKETLKDKALSKVTTSRTNKVDSTNLPTEKSKVKLKYKDSLDISLHSQNDSSGCPPVKSPPWPISNRSPSVSSVASNTSSKIAVRITRSNLMTDGVATNSLGPSLNVSGEKLGTRKPPSVGHRSPMMPPTHGTVPPASVVKSGTGQSTTMQTATSVKNAEGKIQCRKNLLLTVPSTRLSTSKVILQTGKGFKARQPNHGPATSVSKDQTSSKSRGIKPITTAGKGVPHADSVPNTAVGASREINRLEALCESRTKELNFVRLQLKHCALGFDSMAILLQYLVETVGAFSLPSLNQELRRIQEKWQATHVELEEAKAIQQSVADRLVEQQREHAAELERVTAEFGRQATEVEQRLTKDCLKSIDALKLEHQKELEALKEVHCDEVADIHDFYKKQHSDVKRVHQDELKRIQEMLLHEKDESSSIQEERDPDVHDKCCQEMTNLRNKIENLASQCVEFDRLRSEYQRILANDPDTRVQIISARNVELLKEVESLKVVLELRQADVLELRRKNESFILQAEELVRANEEIKKLRAKKEDLEALVEQKAVAERQLSIENQRLKDHHEKELNMTKRLSMENEELQWRLRQGKEVSVSMNMSEGSSFDMAFNKSGTPSSMSMYFWDNEGLSTTGVCPFSQFRTSGPPWKSPQGSPHLSPSKSPQSVGRRPSPATLTRKDRGSSSKRLSSASEDENVADWVDGSQTPPVQLRKKKPLHTETLTTNLKAEVMGSAVENLGEHGVGSDLELTLAASQEEPEDVQDLVSNATSSFSVIDNPPELHVGNISGGAPSYVTTDLDDVQGPSPGLQVEPKLSDDYVEVDHNRNTVLNLSHDSRIPFGTSNTERTSETWTKWGSLFSLSSTKSFIVDDSLEWPSIEIDKLKTVELPGSDSMSSDVKKTILKHSEVIEDGDLSSTVLLWKPKSQYESSIDATHNRHCIRTDSEDLIRTASCMDALSQVPFVDKGDDDTSRTSSGEDLPDDTLSMESLVVGAPFEMSAFDIGSDESSVKSKASIATCDQRSDNGVEILKSPKKTTTLVITYRANRPSISSSRDSSPVNQLGGGTSTAGSDMSESSGTDSSSSSSCRASPIGGDPLPHKVIKLLENSMYAGTRSPRTSAGESMMMFDECAAVGPSSSDPSHVLLKKVLQDHLLLENGSPLLCTNSMDSCLNREQSLDSSPLPEMSKPETPDITNPTLDPPNAASIADVSWSDDDDLPSESEV